MSQLCKPTRVFGPGRAASMVSAGGAVEWLRELLWDNSISLSDLDKAAASAPVGAGGLMYAHSLMDSAPALNYFDHHACSLPVHVLEAEMLFHYSRLCSEANGLRIVHARVHLQVLRSFHNKARFSAVALPLVRCTSTLSAPSLAAW